MEAPTGRKVLLVTSDHRKVGKTYSMELIDYVAAQQQPSGVVSFDLDTDDYDPIKLAKKLASEMGGNADLIPDRATEQAPRSNQELVRLLIPRTATQPAKVWWLVFDGFRSKIPSEPIQDFIAQLGQRIQQREEFRLILLNYTYPLPLAVAGFTFKDNVKPLTRTELETHFASIHRQKYSANPTPKQLSEYLSGMDDRLAEYTQTHPEVVGDHLLFNMAVSDVADAI
jgi:hypothetical protein